MLATYMRRMRNSNLEIRIAVSSCRPQWRYLILIQFYSFLRPWNRVKFWTYLDWAYPIPLGGPFITLSTILAEPFFFLFARFWRSRTCCACAAGLLLGYILEPRPESRALCTAGSGPKITAGQRTMSGKNGVLTSQKLHRPLILEQTNKSSPVNLSFCLFVKIKSRSLKENYSRISWRFSRHLKKSENETWLRKNFFSLSRCRATALKLFWALELGYDHQ